MASSRDFSIYLLKNSFSPENALKDSHNLEKITEENTNLPEGAIMYVADRPGMPPWWKSYWGLSRPLHQVQKGAIVFLPLDNRWIVLTFGMTHHKIKDNSFEYDFGLRTTLNALDPSKIKSTDVLQPESAKRQRVQSPIASSLNFFDIRHDESIIKKLTGAVKPEYKDIFKNATGASSLRISSNVSADQILDLCSSLIEIYGKTDYLQSFPDIQNIVPVKDPDVIRILNSKLLEAFKNAPVDLVLSIPEIVDYSTSFRIKYSGAGRSNKEYSDVFIAGYRDYLEERETEIDDVTMFYRHQMNIIDDNGMTINQYNIFKSFLFDCEIDGNTYHLCEGEWYFVQSSYVQKLQNSLDRFFLDTHSFLHECNEVREDNYNLSIVAANESVLCLDKKNISPQGQKAVEPCDLIISIDNSLHLIHVKVSTRSSSLSHLFNQGVNSIELLRMEEESRDKLKLLVNSVPTLDELIDKGAFSVTFGIITKKDRSHRSKNIPLFSRISLLRAVNTLKMMNIPCSIYYIYDNVDRKEISTTEG